MLGQVEADRMYFLAKPGIFLAISTAVQVWSSKPVFIKSGIYIYIYIYIYHAVDMHACWQSAQ